MNSSPRDSEPSRFSRASASGLRMVLMWLDQRPIHFALIAVLSVVAAVGLRAARPAEADYLDNAPIDYYYFRNRDARDPRDIANKLPNTKDIVLIDVSYLMSRPLFARLLRQLRLAKVVAFDFMFVDQEKELSDEERPLFQNEVKQWRKDTEIFARAMRDNGNVVLARWPEQVLTDPNSADPNLAGSNFDYSSGADLNHAMESSPDTLSDKKVTGSAAWRAVWERAPDALWNAAHCHAHVAVEGGMARHVKLFENTPERTPCLGLAIAGIYLGMKPQQVGNLQIQNGELHLKNHRVAVADNWMRIDYVGGRASFESLENHAVYTAALDYDPEEFRDKIVIIGESSLKSKEILDTPSGPMPGMQVHANIVATLLSSRGAPRELGFWPGAVVSLIACLLLIAPLLRWPLFTSAATALLLAGAMYFLCQQIFAYTHQMLPFSLPLLAIVLTYNVVALYEYRRARETLGRFIGREMVAPTLSLFSRLRVGGRVEEASAFFCDLRGYTSVSERLAPEDTARLISQYTSTLVRVVRKHGGRPIDYQGDGAFVLFEPSLGGAQFAQRAISAALELQIELQSLHQTWKNQGDDIGNTTVGIGIDTGPMMIGLVGANEHLKPGAIGDAVNVAARVQQLSVACGYSILLTRATLEHAGTDFCQTIEIEPCCVQQIRGRQAPLEIFRAGLPLDLDAKS